MTNRLHSGWLVLVAGAVGVFMTTPGQTVGVSAFVDLLAADTGLTRERVLVLYSLGTLLGILPAPLIGCSAAPSCWSCCRSGSCSAAIGLWVTVRCRILGKSVAQPERPRM